MPPTYAKPATEVLVEIGKLVSEFHKSLLKNAAA